MAWWVNHTRVSVCSTLFGAKHHLVLERLGFKPCIRLACYIPMPVCFVSKIFQTSTHLALHLQDHNKIKISFLSLFWCPSGALQQDDKVHQGASLGVLEGLESPDGPEAVADWLGISTRRVGCGSKTLSSPRQVMRSVQEWSWAKKKG